MAISLKEQEIAAEARDKYEASLATLRKFIAGFPEFEQRVTEHDERLNKLESRFVQLRQEISSVVSETSRSGPVVHWSEVGSIETAAASEAPSAYGLRASTNSLRSTGSIRSKVSFCEDDTAVWRYSFESHEGMIPVHGHWLPPEAVSHRPSFTQANASAKRLGGRRLTISPEGIEDVETIECVIVEPMGKILSPAEFVSTGLVICIDGDSHETDVFEKWGEVLKATKWLDCGMSWVLPDVSSLAEAEDLERVVLAVLKQAGFQSCMLVGMGWGGQMISEIAGRSKLSERIDGVLLVAPESPAPTECCYIEVPVMLVWAENDEESPFNEIRGWFEVLSERRAPTFVKDLAKGGHDFTELLKQGETSGQVFHFTAVCLLMGLLLKALDQGSSGLSDPCTRLCDELPCFLASQIGGDPEHGVAAAIYSSDPSRGRRRMERLLGRLKDWIQEGLQEMASATE